MLQPPMGEVAKACGVSKNTVRLALRRSLRISEVTREPALSFACSDQHALALVAFEKAVSLGYQRPALVLDGVIDELTEGRLSAGFLTGQNRLMEVGQQTQPFYQVAAVRNDRSVFAKWFAENQPGVILSLYHEVERWLQELGLTVPGDVGLIQYEWRADHRGWATLIGSHWVDGATVRQIPLGGNLA